MLVQKPSAIDSGCCRRGLMAPPKTPDDGKRRDKVETRRKSGQHNSTKRLLLPHLPFSATTQIDRVQPRSGLQQPCLFYCSRAHTHLLDSQEAYLHVKSSHSVPYPPHLEAGTTAGQRRKQALVTVRPGLPLRGILPFYSCSVISTSCMW